MNFPETLILFFHQNVELVLFNLWACFINVFQKPSFMIHISNSPRYRIGDTSTPWTWLVTLTRKLTNLHDMVLSGTSQPKPTSCWAVLGLLELEMAANLFRLVSCSTTHKLEAVSLWNWCFFLGVVLFDPRRIFGVLPFKSEQRSFPPLLRT